MDSGIFKSYDVRGVYPDELNEESAGIIARAFAHHLQADKIVLGLDDRKSSPKLREAIIRALNSSGVDVYDIGMCPTPLLAYAAAARGFHGAIMISASHNPPQYNAMKLLKDGIQLSSPGELDAVKRLVENHYQIQPVKQGTGQTFSLDTLKDYTAEVAEHFIRVRGLKVAIDYSNGMGSITAKPVLQRLGLTIIPLNEKIDGTFPNHAPNPSDEKNLEQLRAAVLKEGADCGVFFDGDADRAFFIDSTGRTIYPDIITAILAPEELKGRTEKHVYYDLRFSRIVPHAVKECRGEPVMMRVGNPFYKEKLKNDGGVFAAELSGHIMFKDHYCIDDGLYAALKVLAVIFDSRKSLSELAGPLMKYYSTPELSFEAKDPDLVLKKAREAFRDGESVELDGVYISYPDWWFSLRKSNTEPLVRLRIEADTKEKLDEMKKKITSMLV